MGSPSKRPSKRKNFNVDGSPEPKKSRNDSRDRDEANQSSPPPQISQRSPTVNLPETAGRIKKIYLRNILCHDSLEIDFNPNVNFIVGKNGSGKSAILVALVVGLGTGARATERGKNMKDIVKTGCTRASIEITLTNVGPMAYKPDVYGNTIKVVRTFGISSSSSGYKLISSNNETISKSKRDLDHMLTSMNIQPQNPISVMNQETSASFLTNSTEESRYQIFMKATQLELIGQNYKDALIESQETQRILTNTSDQLMKEKKQMEKLERDIAVLESLDKIKETYANLETELKWAIVIMEEERLAKAKHDLEACEKLLTERIATQENEGKKIEEIDSQLKILHDELNGIDEETQNSRQKYDDVKERYQAKRDEVNAKKRELNSCRGRINYSKQNIKMLTDEIARLKGGNNQAEEARNAQKEQLTNCKERFEQIEAMMKTNQVNQQHLEADKLRLQKDERSLLMELERKNTECRRIRNQLDGLRNQSSDTRSVFGTNIPRLLRRIHEEHSKGRFKKKPIGPMGSYIKLKDPTWVPAVELLLNLGFLSTFCVDNSQDSKTLSYIIKEIYHDDHHTPSIYCSKFHPQVHDISRTCSGNELYPNLFHSMEISNPVVANALIDRIEADLIILIPTSAEATQVMQYAANVPRNCRRAITKKGDTFFPDPKYKTYGGKVADRARWLQVSTCEAIALLEEELAVAEREKLQRNDEYKIIHEKLQASTREFDDIVGQLYKLNDMRNKLRREIDRLNDTLPEENIDDCTVFETEKNDLEEKLKTQQLEMECLEEEIRKSEVEMKKLGAETNTFKDEVDSRNERVRAINENIRILQRKKSSINSTKDYSMKNIEKARYDFEAITESVGNYERSVLEATETAEAAGPRIDTTRTTQQIERARKDLKVQIEQVERKFGSKEKLKEALKEKQDKNRDIFAFYRKITKVNKKHLERVEQRRSEFYKLKKETSNRIKIAFTSVLAIRHYDGSVVIDHGNKKLILDVVPRDNRQVQRTFNDVHTLSGGERSYSTVAFILALWDCTKVPFYFLDEFDVFMDKLNRRTTMDLLMHHARTHPEKQFAFLTPLDASCVTASDTLTIHRMAAPERKGGSQSQN